MDQANTSKTVPDWLAIDWENKTNTQIGEETGAPAPVVSYYRKLLGKRRGSALWDAVDWSKNNQQISQETGKSVSAISYNRYLRNAPRTSGYQRVVTPEMLETVDWPLTKDADIARTWHVSRERVRQIRNQKGLPACVVSVTGDKSKEAIKWLFQNRAQIEGKHAREVADSCPVYLPRFRKYQLMKRTSIQFDWSPPKVIHDEINFDLPNTLLDAIWNKRNFHGNYRCAYAKQRPKWKAKPGFGGTKLSELPKLYPEMLPVVYEEISKAVARGITPDWEHLERMGIPRIN